MRELSRVFQWAGILALESLRLIEINLRERRVSKLELVPLPLLTTAGEGGCAIRCDPKTNRNIRVSIGQDIVNRGFSGFIDVHNRERMIRQRIYIKPEIALNLDDVSDTVLAPAIEELLDIIAPLRPELPPMRADFSYQSGV